MDIINIIINNSKKKKNEATTTMDGCIVISKFDYSKMNDNKLCH